MSSGPIRSPQDFWGGVFIVAIAAVALWLGRDLPAGTLGAIGPGMIPRSFAAILGVLGLLLAASAFVTEGAGIGRLSLRGVILVPVAVLAFAYTVRPLGLVVATPLAILVASAASSETRWGEAIVFAAVVTALCIGLFKYALRLPIPLAPFLLGYEGAMTDLIGNLGLGFATALSPSNLLLCFIGCLVGTLVGVLPGVGPIATIAMLMPLTFQFEPTGALIMLAGIYYGAQYGGSTTAILINVPGEATSVVTALDGHQMARLGRAGAALGIAAIASFIAGSVATVVIAALGHPMTRLAQVFGPADYFALMLFGLALAVVLARGSVLKAVIMIVLGLLLSTIGTDLETGQERLTMGIASLSDGFDFAVLAMGVFGVAEILRNLDDPEARDVVKSTIGSLLPTRAEFAASFKPILRGTTLGSILGILPGNGAVLAPFASYTLEKKLAEDPSRFGRGAIEGVAGPEAANNAGAQTSFIPLLTLGIPPNAVMALMMGAMTIKNVIPGPQVMTKNPELFWGLIASMWIGNLMLLIINLPLIGLWVRLLKVPYRLLFPAIVALCCIGIYSINNTPEDVVAVAACAVGGYVLIKLGFEPAPMLLGFVLGKLMEEKLRQALGISRGDFLTFVKEPVSAVLLILTLGLLVFAILPAVRSKREQAFEE